MKTDILMNGSMVKKHISLKTGFGYNATRRTSFLSWFQACQRVRPPVLIIQLQRHLQDRRGLVLHLLQARLLHQRQQHQVIVRLEKERIEKKMIPLLCLSSFKVDDRTGTPVVCRESNHEQGRQANQKSPKTNKKETMIERGHPLFADSGRASSEIPEWLQEFRENLVDDGVPEPRDSHASSFHEVSSEPTSKRSAELSKHSVYTHFTKDRICQRTKVTTARAEDALAEPYLMQKILVT